MQTIDKLGDYTLYKNAHGNWQINGPDTDIHLAVEKGLGDTESVVTVKLSEMGPIGFADAADFGQELIRASQAAAYFNAVVNLHERD